MSENNTSNTGSAAEERKAELEAQILELDLADRQADAELNVQLLAVKKMQAERDMAEAKYRKGSAIRNNIVSRKAHAEYIREKALLKSIDNHRVFDFVDSVSDESVLDLIDALRSWELRDEVDGVKRPIMIKLNSPGGSVIDGFDAYDHVMDMRSRGWKIDTIACGIAASMAGILLQMGEERLISKNATLHMHEIGSFTYGKTSETKDQVKFTDALEAKGAAIYAERSTLTADEVLEMWARKEVYMSAKEAHDLGLVDRIV